MKASQIVGIILGFILIFLAMFVALFGYVPTDTTQGMISIGASLLLGAMVVLSSLKEPKAAQKPAQAPTSFCPYCGKQVQQEQVACPHCGRSLPQAEPPPPPDWTPPTQASATAPPVNKQKQIVIAVLAVVIVVVLVLVFFGSSFLGLGGPASGNWEGTATYYYLDYWGERDSRITATCEMDLRQSGSSVTGTLDIYVVTQTDVGEPGYVPAVDEHIEVNGQVNGTKLVIYTESYIAGQDYEDFFEFTINGNEMVGQVMNLDDYAYLGIESDVGAFVLTK